MNSGREAKIRRAAAATQPDLTVVLENIFDPLNISAVMRSCDAVGIREIFVLYTQHYLDKRGLVLGKRTSGGTFKWTDVYVFEDMDACFQQLRQRFGRVLATLPGEQSHSLYDLNLNEPAALLFGNEDEGISPEALSRCDGFFTIPQAGFAESLNISVACAVTLYEAYRQRAAVGNYSTHPRLNAQQQEALIQRWKTMLKDSETRNRGQWIGKNDPIIPPVFAERAATPVTQLPKSGYPLSNFDL
jgi:tRNA (guanosine-2'-O-)-methyltransferase